MIMKWEYDFEGTWTTIPRVRDATGQGGDGGALVRVHEGRGQDTCISEQAQRTCRTPTASGVDGVRTVERERARRMDVSRTRGERGFGGRVLRAVENDFDGTRMTIPRARDATGQGGDGGAFVRVHAGRGR